jgi:hypothetical protein
MNRFKILKIPELKPCFAPMEKTEKTVQGLSRGPVGATGAQGYSSIQGYTGALDYISLETLRDIQMMHGIVVPRNHNSFDIRND